MSNNPIADTGGNGLESGGATLSLKTVHDRVYEDLRAMLMAGVFRPGQKLTLRMLATSFGISLTPVRESIKRLIAEGAIEVRSSRTMHIPIMTGNTLNELLQIRLRLEPLAAEHAAHNATDRQLVALRKISQEISAARDRGDQKFDMQKMYEFYITLYSFSGFSYLQRIIENIWTKTGPYLNLLFPDYIHSRRGDSARDRILSAMENRDPQAAGIAVHDDIESAMFYLMTHVDEEGLIHPRRTKLKSFTGKQPNQRDSLIGSIIAFRDKTKPETDDES